MLKRVISVLMICFVLTFTSAGDYLGIGNKEVYAAGEALILKAIIEAIMLSMGLSFSSTADLNSVASGLQANMDANLDVQYGEKSVFRELKEKIGTIKDISMIPTVVISSQLYTYLKQYLYNSSADKISASSDVKNPITSDIGVETERVKFSTLEDLPDMFYGKPVKFSDTQGATWRGDEYIKNTPVIVTELVQTGSSPILNLYWVDASYKLILAYNNAINIENSDIKKGYELFRMDGTKNGVRYYKSSFTYDSVKSYFRASKTFQGYIHWNNSSPTYDTDYDILPLGRNVEGQSAVYKVFLNNGTKVYSSFADYSIMEFSSIYRPQTSVFGSSVAAKPLEGDGAGGVKLKVKNPIATKQVEESINSAKAANPSITEAELNAAASDIVASMNGVEDAVNNNTTTLSTLLTSILASLRDVAANVAKISVGDGSAALDWNDVQDAFEDTKTAPGEGDNDNHDPKVWIPGAIGVSVLLKPLLDFLGEPLSEITKFLDVLVGSVGTLTESVGEWIMDIPSNIKDVLSEYDLPLDVIIGGITSIPGQIVDFLSEYDFPLDVIINALAGLPGDIVDAIGNGFIVDVPDITLPDITVPDIEVPDVIFPEITIPDYTGLLDRIIELLEHLFVIDTTALALSIAGFDTIWENKLPVGKLVAVFDGFRFDNNYVYPKIDIPTPDIIKTYYKKEAIMLIDFEEYSTYCLYVRNIIRATFWFGFVMALVRHFRTRYHIA